MYLTMYIFVKDAKDKLPIWDDQASSFSVFTDSAIFYKPVLIFFKLKHRRHSKYPVYE
jgi:hypothetical protein